MKIGMLVFDKAIQGWYNHRQVNKTFQVSDNCGSHIITTDYPPRYVRAQEHIYDFDGYTIKLLK